MTDTQTLPPLDLSNVSPERQRLDFELVFSIANDITNQSSLRDLLNRAVERVREGYALYHAQIYLYDADLNKLVLAGSSGEAGRRLLANGHRIDFNHSTSIVTRAARQRQPVLVNDVEQSETFLPNPLLPDISSELAVPMVVGDVLVGVLDIQSEEVNHFTAHDIRIQTLLAEQLAIAVQNTRYTERMARYTINMNTAFEVGREIARQRTSADLLWSVANLCKTRFGLYHVHIYLYDPDNQRLTLRAASSDIGQQQVARGHAIPSNRLQSIVARAARERRPVVSGDVTAEEFYLPNPLLPDTRSEMAIPMEDNEGLIGILDVQATEISRFDASDIETFGVLAGQVASAVLNARAFEAIQAAERQSRLLAGVAENSPVGVYVYQLEDTENPLSLHLRVANPASQNATGVEPSAVLGKTIGEAFPALASSPIPEIYANVIKTGQQVYLGEVPYTHPGGEPQITR